MLNVIYDYNEFHNILEGLLKKNFDINIKFDRKLYIEKCFKFNIIFSLGKLLSANNQNSFLYELKRYIYFSLLKVYFLYKNLVKYN